MKSSDVFTKLISVSIIFAFICSGNVYPLNYNDTLRKPMGSDALSRMVITNQLTTDTYNPAAEKLAALNPEIDGIGRGAHLFNIIEKRDIETLRAMVPDLQKIIEGMRENPGISSRDAKISYLCMYAVMALRVAEETDVLKEFVPFLEEIAKDSAAYNVLRAEALRTMVFVNANDTLRSLIPAIETIIADTYRFSHLTDNNKLLFIAALEVLINLQAYDTLVKLESELKTIDKKGYMYQDGERVVMQKAFDIISANRSRLDDSSAQGPTLASNHRVSSRRITEKEIERIKDLVETARWGNFREQDNAKEALHKELVRLNLSDAINIYLLIERSKSEKIPSILKEINHRLRIARLPIARLANSLIERKYRSGLKEQLIKMKEKPSRKRISVLRDVDDESITSKLLGVEEWEPYYRKKLADAIDTAIYNYALIAEITSEKEVVLAVRAIVGTLRVGEGYADKQPDSEAMQDWGANYAYRVVWSDFSSIDNLRELMQAQAATKGHSLASGETLNSIQVSAGKASKPLSIMYGRKSPFKMNADAILKSTSGNTMLLREFLEYVASDVDIDMKQWREGGVIVFQSGFHTVYLHTKLYGHAAVDLLEDIATNREDLNASLLKLTLLYGYTANRDFLKVAATPRTRKIINLQQDQRKPFRGAAGIAPSIAVTTGL